jgi:hypothetical protein
MSSVQGAAKQVGTGDLGYFINLADMTGKVFAYNPTAAVPFSTAAWCASGAGRSLSSLRTIGGAILKDMGKTVVSSLRTFRKVQLVLPGSNSTLSTFGVGGGSATPSGEDYWTGYIELGFEGNGAPAPVAHFGR